MNAPTPLATIVQGLLASRGFAHKSDIAGAVDRLAAAALPGRTVIPNGDDCAALADGNGFLLFAIEGFVEDFVARMPWFAGYSSVMVNVSDIAAMGGRPLAITDAIWSRNAAEAGEVFAGMVAAAERYQVPIVGGHTNHRAASGNLAVSIIGRANRLLTSFDAREGDVLVMAIDLRGRFMDPYPFWNASTDAPAERLRGDLDILPRLAEDGVCKAAKDISMAGAVGTALMLLEGSRVGGTIDLDAIPRPPGAPLARWLEAFPSYGYVLSVPQSQAAEVLMRFAARDIEAAIVGRVEAGSELWLESGGERARLWNHSAQPFVGAGSGAQS